MKSTVCGLSRLRCASCAAETIHKKGACIHCGTKFKSGYRKPKKQVFTIKRRA